MSQQLRCYREGGVKALSHQCVPLDLMKSALPGLSYFLCLVQLLHLISQKISSSQGGTQVYFHLKFLYDFPRNFHPSAEAVQPFQAVFLLLK